MVSSSVLVKVYYANYNNCFDCFIFFPERKLDQFLSSSAVKEKNSNNNGPAETPEVEVLELDCPSSSTKENLVNNAQQSEEDSAYCSDDINSQNSSEPLTDSQTTVIIEEPSNECSEDNNTSEEVSSIEPSLGNNQDGHDVSPQCQELEILEKSPKSIAHSDLEAKDKRSEIIPKANCSQEPPLSDIEEGNKSDTEVDTDTKRSEVVEINLPVDSAEVHEEQQIELVCINFAIFGSSIFLFEKVRQSEKK